MPPQHFELQEWAIILNYAWENEQEYFIYLEQLYFLTNI